MSNVELVWVTEHLGHTPDVHKTWYRQEASTVELTKVAKLLTAKDNNASFKNKKLRDITGNRFSCISIFNLINSTFLSFGFYFYYFLFLCM